MSVPRYLPLSQEYYWVGWYDYGFVDSDYKEFDSLDDARQFFKELANRGYPEICLYEVPGYCFDKDSVLLDYHESSQEVV